MSKRVFFGFIAICFVAFIIFQKSIIFSNKVKEPIPFKDGDYLEYSHDLAFNSGLKSDQGISFNYTVNRVADSNFKIIEKSLYYTDRKNVHENDIYSGNTIEADKYGKILKVVDSIGGIPENFIGHDINFWLPASRRYLGEKLYSQEFSNEFSISKKTIWGKWDVWEAYNKENGFDYYLYYETNGGFLVGYVYKTNAGVTTSTLIDTNLDINH